MNQTSEVFRELFENQLRLTRNSTCEACDPLIKKPLLPWLVGDDFANTEERLVFVGKPHRGKPGDILPSGIMDPTNQMKGSDALWEDRSAYWSYTREIAQRLFGDQAFRSIAMTNIVKCTNTCDTDKTTSKMARNCVTELAVIWEEFRCIKPLTAIFYTYSLFPDLIIDIPIAKPGSVKRVTSYEHKVECGEKSLGWWEREFTALWGDRIRILVVGHPERMKKKEYVDRLVTWVRGERSGNGVNMQSKWANEI